MGYIGNQDYNIIEANISTVTGTDTAANIVALPNDNGALWIASDTGHLFLNDGSQWHDVGQLQGDTGPQGVGVTGISKTSTSGLVDTYTVTFSDMSTTTYTITNGKGIVGVARTSGDGSEGTLDTYTITYNDSTTSTYKVYNGADGNTWLTGSTAPLAGDGSDGDLYLNTATNFYYEKVAGAWVLKGTLKGDAYSYSAAGALAGRGAYDTEAAGFGYLSLDEAVPTVYFKLSAVSGDWSIGTAVGRGAGISNVTKTGALGNVDTYTITYDDLSTSTFTVTNANIDDSQITATNTWSANKIAQALGNATSKPTFTTDAVTNISRTTATFNGTISDFGDASSSLQYRFIYGPTTAMEEGATTWTTVSAIGAVSASITNASRSTTYYALMQIRDTNKPNSMGTLPDVGAWDTKRTSFTTTNAYIATPTLSVTGYPNNVTTTPTLYTSAFSAINAPDTHASTTWRARNSGGTVVWESVENTANKTAMTIPYGYLQLDTTYSFEVIHIGQTLGASAVGSISATTANSPIGVAGSVGFGVGVAPGTLVTSFGLTPMPGYNDPTHANFGNYTDASGSVMVYVPKHYVKLSHNTAAPYNGLQVDISDYAQTGYSLPRCFINNGVEVAGIFVDKYLGGREGGVMVSKRNLDPVSVYPDHNPITALTANSQSPAANHEGMYAAVKTRGANYSLTTIFTYTMLANLADAHYQACYRNNNFAPCAWADVAPYQPKGCNNNALKDANDANVVYTGSGFQACGLTGGVADSVFAKITHNGQKCGVVDLNGGMWEVAAGYITSAAGAHLVLKESVDVKNLTAAVAYTTANYDALTMPLTLDNTLVRFGNGTNQFFSGNTDRTTNAYKLDNLGLPLNDSAVSTSGTNRFGGDGFWRYRANEMCPIVGGCYADFGLSGVRIRALYAVRSSSGTTSGGRACLVPSVAG